MKKKSLKQHMDPNSRAPHAIAAVDQTRRYVADRLDQSLPLVTEEWQKVEQLLNLMTEFAPTYLIMEMASAFADYADDQARSGYLLGQEDLIKELRRLTA